MNHPSYKPEDACTPEQLADALTRLAQKNTPGENTAFVRVDVRLLDRAAKMIRALASRDKSVPGPPSDKSTY